ncbi:MAG: 3-hydroxyacyl-CoA dehydrogenase family protein [Pirellulaceae bacterium]|nr:3-hydroxyacyl-CoA dehydrogenase family protein [Pirellulaceae bacterium]
MNLKTVGVVGLGLLGRGIAACLLGHGFRVVAYTRRQATHDEARAYIGRAIRDLVQHAGFAPELTDAWPERYTPVDTIQAVADCGFVIESVAEDQTVKRQVFDEIESVVGRGVPIASNTSSLPITCLQQGCKQPDRLLGMHWAEPAHATRFLELIRGEQTSDETLSAAVDLARALGKEPSLVLKDIPAFLVNRIGYAMYREALNLLELGVADVETIDRSCRNALGLWATICGPFRWIDLTGGPALYGRAMQGVLPTLSTATELPPRMQRLMDSDARGIANGRGFYQYSEEEARQWEELYLQHAWTVRELTNRYFGGVDG